METALWVTGYRVPAETASDVLVGAYTAVCVTICAALGKVASSPLSFRHAM